MSPRATFLLSLIGVLAVGASLHLLVQEPPASPAMVKQVNAPVESVFATVEFVVQPESLTLHHGGMKWDVDTSLNPAEVELELPRTPEVDIEVHASWAADSPAASVLTITLEPEGRESRSVTEWSRDGSRTLHSIFSFRW